MCDVYKTKLSVLVDLLLNFTTVWTNSADKKLIIFSYFSRKQDLIFHA